VQVTQRENVTARDDPFPIIFVDVRRDAPPSRDDGSIA
jgi:hypothetical protein